MAVFYVPSTNLIGPGVVNEVGDYIKDLGLNKALLVTDHFLSTSPLLDKLKKPLDEAGIEYVVFSDVDPNPSVDNVLEGLSILKDENCDFIISFGGGSPQDTASSISIMATNGGKVQDYEGVNKSEHKGLPVVAVNTTAGTSAEVTINYVITDTERKVKMVMVDKNSLATITVNDPELMINQPASLTRSTGMDALTHAVESLVTPGAYPATKKMSKGAVELIYQNLPICYKEPGNLEARTNMVNAIFIGGIAFSNAGLGFVHSMAHQLGSVYDLPHGIACAMLLPIVEKENAKRFPERFRDVAEAFGLHTEGKSDEECAKYSIDTIVSLKEELGIPEKLNDLEGVNIPEDEFDFEMLSKNALKDACAPANPFMPTLEETIAMYKELY